jgi:hypothetical protein
MTQPPASTVTVTLRIPSDLSATDFILEMKHALMMGITVVDLDWPEQERAKPRAA